VPEGIRTLVVGIELTRIIIAPRVLLCISSVFDIFIDVFTKLYLGIRNKSGEKGEEGEFEPTIC
jgi:hypothetical protein